MPPLAHHPLPIHHHIAHLAVPASEQPAVENGIAVCHCDVRVLPIEYQPVGPLAHRQLADGLPERLGTAAQGRVIQRAPDHRLVASVQPVAALIA
ncbi:hypothetical protein D3C79_924950 [compost metagenome]